MLNQPGLLQLQRAVFLQFKGRRKIKEDTACHLNYMLLHNSALMEAERLMAFH
jgi:hypothetical protein